MDPVDEVFPRIRHGAPHPQVLQDVFERRHAEEWHAHGLELVGLMKRIDRHDVSMSELGQRLGFLEEVSGGLQDNEAISQVPLSG
jgi:hypothetical protein